MLFGNWLPRIGPNLALRKNEATVWRSDAPDGCGLRTPTGSPSSWFTTWLGSLRSESSDRTYRLLKIAAEGIEHQHRGEVHVRAFLFARKDLNGLRARDARMGQTHASSSSPELPQVNRDGWDRGKPAEVDLLAHGLVRIIWPSIDVRGELPDSGGSWHPERRGDITGQGRATSNSGWA